MSVPKYPKISAAFVVFSLFTALCSTGLIIYLMMFEKPYLSYPNLPIPVLNKIVYPGDVVPMEVTRCNSTSKQKVFTVARFLSSMDKDQDVIILPAVGLVAESGCTTKTTLYNKIPELTRPGHYQIIGLANVQGIIRDFTVESYTETFEVLAKP